jgi:hypothetical protein
MELPLTFNKMKMILCLIAFTGLFLTTGCEIEEHEHRGGYYGPREYGYGEYHSYPRHDGYWDRGHYYRFHYDND